MKYDFFYDFCIGNYSEKRRFPCYIIKNNEVQVTLIEDEDRAVYDRIDLTGQILNNSIDYIITSVIIQCDVKHLLLPFTVESVTIDRPNGKKYCNADNCRIELQSGINLFLLGTSAGSLFSKDMNIEEIALEVGYNCGNYFSKVFKKYLGISPKEYREYNNYEEIRGIFFD